jgi:hypothetical protein
MSLGCILFFARRERDGRVWCERCERMVELQMAPDGHNVVGVRCGREATGATAGTQRTEVRQA